MLDGGGSLFGVIATELARGAAHFAVASLSSPRAQEVHCPAPAPCPEVDESAVAAKCVEGVAVYIGVILLSGGNLVLVAFIGGVVVGRWSHGAGGVAGRRRGGGVLE